MPKKRNKKQSLIQKIRPTTRLSALVVIALVAVAGTYVVLQARAAVANPGLSLSGNASLTSRADVSPLIYSLNLNGKVANPKAGTNYNITWRVTISPAAPGSSGTMDGATSGTFSINSTYQVKKTVRVVGCVLIRLAATSSPSHPIQVGGGLEGPIGQCPSPAPTPSPEPDDEGEDGDGEDGDGDGDGGTGTGTNGDGSGTGPGPTPGPVGGGGGGGSNTAKIQAPEPRPIPTASNQGVAKTPPVAEPSPFVDGKEYKRGSDPDMLLFNQNVGGSKTLKAWVYVVAVLLIAGGAAAYILWWRPKHRKATRKK